MLSLFVTRDRQFLKKKQVFAFRVPCCGVRIKRCSVRLYSLLFVGGLVTYLSCLYLFAYSCEQHVLTIWVTWWVSFPSRTTGFTLDCWWVSVSGHFIFLHCVLFVVVPCLVGRTLPDSIDFPFLIALSVFSNVYLCYW